MSCLSDYYAAKDAEQSDGSVDWSQVPARNGGARSPTTRRTAPGGRTRMTPRSPTATPSSAEGTDVPPMVFSVKHD